MKWILVDKNNKNNDNKKVIDEYFDLVRELKTDKHENDGDADDKRSS